MFGKHLFAAILLCGPMAPMWMQDSQSPAAEQATPRPSYTRPVKKPTSNVVREVHVDERCRVLPDPAQVAAAKHKIKPIWDDEICRLESVNSSSHEETRMTDNKQEHSTVKIEEQEFVLENVTNEPVTFVVEYPVRKDWTVDSFPPPTAVISVADGSKVRQTAIFKANAAPNELVRLHVGVRHDKFRKPTQPAADARPAGN